MSRNAFLQRALRRLSFIVLLGLVAALLCTGCVHSGIRELETRRDLPALDPEAGLAREIRCTLYARILEEPYLAGAERSVEVAAGERVEHAIVAALLEEPTAIAGTEGKLFPDGTHIVDINLDGSILYVTLSEAFMDREALQEEEEFLAREYRRKTLGEAEYAARRDALYQAHYEERWLALHALVNTLTDYNEKLRVLLLVDVDGSGVGTRLSGSDFGISDAEKGESGLIEPMRFDASSIITPYDMVEVLMAHLQNQEYVQAYALTLHTASEDTEGDRERVAALADCGQVEFYSVNGLTGMGTESSYANVDLRLQKAGETYNLRNRKLLMRMTDGILRPDYTSLIQLLEAS